MSLFPCGSSDPPRGACCLGCTAPGKRLVCATTHARYRHIAQTRSRPADSLLDSLVVKIWMNGDFSGHEAPRTKRLTSSHLLSWQRLALTHRQQPATDEPPCGAMRKPVAAADNGHARFFRVAPAPSATAWSADVFRLARCSRPLASACAGATAYECLGGAHVAIAFPDDAAKMLSNMNKNTHMLTSKGDTPVRAVTRTRGGWRLPTLNMTTSGMTNRKVSIACEAQERHPVAGEAARHLSPAVTTTW